MSTYLVVYRVGLNQEAELVVRAVSAEHVRLLVSTTNIELVRIEALNDQIAA